MPNGNNKNGKEKADKLTNGGKKRDLKPDFIENLKRSMNNATIACKNTNISRDTYYKWLKEDKEFSKQCKEIIPEQNLDFVESKLFELINGVTCSKYVKGKEVIYKRPPDNTSVIFYLKTKGKQRGYIERVETQLSGQVSNIPQAQINVINTKKNAEAKK